MTHPLPFDPRQPWLAPLAGFSDLPFRLLCRELGAAVTVTEMVSAKGLVYDSRNTQPILATSAADSPLVVQLFGSEPEFVGRAMDLLLARGFTWFDLNCGCSVPKVVKTGSGAALMKDPDLLLAVAKAMIERAGPQRVGVKMRMGWNPAGENYLDVAKALEQAGVGWLTLHPRYAQQGFTGQAAWTAVARLRQGVSIPVLASGDLFTAEDAARCLRETCASGVMFARGALRDPAVFMRLRAALDASEAPVPSLAWIIRRHVRLIHEHGQPSREMLKMRTIVPRYVRHIDGCKELRQRLVMCSSWEELEHIVLDIERVEAASPADASCVETVTAERY